MKKKIEYWLVPLIILVGEVILFMMFFFASPPYQFAIVLKSVESSFAPVRFFLVIPLIVVGLAILSYITIVFIHRYKTSPSETRFIVMTSLLNLTIAMAIFFFDTTWRFTEKIIKQFFRSLSIYFLEFSIYFLLLFGLNILLNIEKGKKQKGLKILLNVLLLVNYTLYFAGETESILNQVEKPELLEYGDYSLYAVVVLSIILLLIMAIRSLTIQKRTSDQDYKSGLRALANSFIVVVAAIVAGVTERFIDNEMVGDGLRVSTVILAIIGFYF
ncbi:MAG: hypothetical protein ACFFCS_25180, partial [Candidatus Hodarchaeota archaeon]